MRFNRRTFTKSAGASLLLAPFYKFLETKKAYAAGTPRRVLIYHNQPVDTKLWNPGAGSGETGITLPEMFKPMEALLPNMVMVDGMQPMRPGDNHFSPHALTGVGREGRPDGGIISIEQFIGDALEKTPDKRPIKNLILGATAASESVFYRKSARLPT
ncbi:MAG TPA: hypothetical protein VN914_16485, partial [Polyangia bacterium]|nr:hypothetical protein [Polyangia bacterium]